MSLIRSCVTICTAFCLIAGVFGESIVPGSYILEFAEEDATKDTLFSKLSSLKISATAGLDLKFGLFNGLSLRVSADNSDEVMDLINSLDIVKNVWPTKYLGRPEPIVHSIFDNSHTAGSGLGYLGKRDGIAGLDDNNYPHRLCEVDKLHAKGFTGKGMFIGVIDSGVDYKHEALGGCFGPGCKIRTGYDMVGSDYNGYNTPVPDSDPMDVQGHGTHICGIIAAATNKLNFTGVAPDATLGVWKIFGKEGGYGEDVLIQALNMAYEAGVTIISGSIGDAAGWSSTATSTMIDRITARGVHVVFSAGNNGMGGLFISSSLGSATSSISVGSADNSVVPYVNNIGKYQIRHENLTLNDTLVKFEYAQPNTGQFQTVSLPLYATSLNTSVLDDACAPLPAITPDLSKYVSLVQYGGCALQDKIDNLKAANAINVLFYENDTTNPRAIYVAYYFQNTSVIAGGIFQELAISWLILLAQNTTVTVHVTPNYDAELVYHQINNTFTAGGPSYFTSWGPTFDGYVKPQLMAPGGYILSTYINNTYAMLSGTSMAAPYISGLVALIQQIRGRTTLTPAQMSSLLETTATPMRADNASAFLDYLAPVIQQGGGLVNANKAAYTTTLVDKNNIALNDTQYFKTDHTVTITNLALKAQTYYFGHVLAPTVYTLGDNGSYVPSVFMTPNGVVELDVDSASTAAASVKFDSSSLTIPGRSRRSFKVYFTPPGGLNATRIPVYSGFISITGTIDGVISIPYSGTATKMKSVQIMDTQNGFPWLCSSNGSYVNHDETYKLTMENDTAIAANHIFTMPDIASRVTQYPSVVFKCAMVSPYIRIDAVPSDTKNVPLVLGMPALEIRILPLAGGLSFVNTAMQRNQALFAQWDGTLLNGRKAPAGKYKFLVRMLKIFGDIKSGKDYESYYTVEFELQYETTYKFSKN